MPSSPKPAGTGGRHDAASAEAKAASAEVRTPTPPASEEAGAVALPEGVPEGERELVAELLGRGILQPGPLPGAIELCQAAGGSLGEVLVRLGLVRERVLVETLATLRRMRFVDPDEHEVDRALFAKLPRAVLERHLAVPLAHPDPEHAVVLAVADPDDFAVLDEVQFLAERPVEAALAPRSAIRRALARARRAGAGAPPPPSPRDLERRVEEADADALLKGLLLVLAEENKIPLAKILDRAAEIERQRARRAGGASRE